MEKESLEHGTQTEEGPASGRVPDGNAVVVGEDFKLTFGDGSAGLEGVTGDRR